MACETHALPVLECRCAPQKLWFHGLKAGLTRGVDFGNLLSHSSHEKDSAMLI